VENFGFLFALATLDVLAICILFPIISGVVPDQSPTVGRFRHV
jgi:hypothetical protein